MNARARPPAPDDRADSAEDRPTLCPTFDVEEYARESDARLVQHVAADATCEVPADALEDPSDRDLEAVYRARIGGEDQVVAPACAPESLMHVPRIAVEGFVLAVVDGRSSVGAVLRRCGLPPLEALAALCQLLDRNILALRPAG